MITLFVLDPVEDDILPRVYSIPFDKQIEVERCASECSKLDQSLEEKIISFEYMLTRKGIGYGKIGTMFCAGARNVDWIDDNIPRAVI